MAGRDGGDNQRHYGTGTGTAYHLTALPTVGPYALPIPSFVPGRGSSFGLTDDCREGEEEDGELEGQDDQRHLSPEPHGSV